MPKKQWETVMLSKPTKERLKALKGSQSYESFITSLLADSDTPSLNMEQLVKDYLDPIKSYIKETTPSEKLIKQTQEIIEEYNEMEEELEKAHKRIRTLTQENDRLRKKKR